MVYSNTAVWGGGMSMANQVACFFSHFFEALNDYFGVQFCSELHFHTLN